MKTLELQFYRYRDLGKCHWIPAADVYQTHFGWLIKVELAGVRKEDLSVKIEGSKVLVSGVRLDHTVSFGHHPYSLEISYNAFERIIELPMERPEPSFSIDACNLGTEFIDGMLLVYVSKQETSP